MKHIIKTAIALVLIAASFTACKKEKLGANVKKFNVAKFRENLKAQIDTSATTQPMGYSFVINKEGKLADSFSKGIAYIDTKSGTSGAWNINQEINIASVTKTMTAVAVFQLMKKNKLALTDKIDTWLPAAYFPAQVIKDITFGELLTHSSGITESSTSYDSIRMVISQGLVTLPKPKNSYSNVNFAIFRIIIPYLRDKATMQSLEKSMMPGQRDAFEKLLSSNYISYMQNNVFTPAGLPDITCKPGANTAQAFSEPSGRGQASANLGDWTETCGGGGYFMSVREMAKFMAYLSHTYTLLDYEQRIMMDTNFGGWDTWNSPMTLAGKAYGKDGALRWDSNNNGVAPDAGDAGLQTLVMKFPNGVELALAINSLPGSWRGLSSIARNAYNGAWE
jgi:CubicO group peptidase (beta-lactamase class C family)